MYNHQPKNYICDFCLIAKRIPTSLGDQNEDIVYQDQFLTAFISAKWWKSNKGHIIIITNAHYENIYSLPEDLGHKIFDLSKKVSIAIKKGYKCDGTSQRQHNEPAGNQDIWHYHLHIFPRYINDNLYLSHNQTFWPPAKERKLYAQKLKKYLTSEK